MRKRNVVRRGEKLPQPKSLPEELLASEMRAADLPVPEREHRFDEKRRWRFDFAWPDFKVAAEVDGGIWSGGRHTTGRGFTRDCEKLNAATLQGWRVYRFTPAMVSTGEALRTVTRALGFPVRS